MTIYRKPTGYDSPELITWRPVVPVEPDYEIAIEPSGQVGAVSQGILPLGDPDVHGSLGMEPGIYQMIRIWKLGDDDVVDGEDSTP